MDFSYSEDQSMFVASCERLVREQCGFDARRAVARSPAEKVPPLWAEFAQLGLTSLLVPEELGGLARPLIDGVLVAQALGRGMAAWSLSLTARLPRGPRGALAAGRRARRGALAAIADGRSIRPCRSARRKVAAAKCAARQRTRASGCGSVRRRRAPVPAAAVDGEPARLAPVRRHRGGRGERAHRRRGRDRPGRGRRCRLAGGARGGAHRPHRRGRRPGPRRDRRHPPSTCGRGGSSAKPIGRFQALAHRMADLAIRHEQAQSLLLAAAMWLDAADGARTLDAAQVMAHRAFRSIGPGGGATGTAASA